MTLEEVFERALKAAQEGRLEDAEKLYKKCLELEPQHPEVWNNLGNVYRKAGQIAKSVEAYQKAIELDPKYVLAYFNLASALMDIERYDLAKLFLLKVREMNFEMVKSTAMLIVCLLQLNEELEALKLFREVKGNEDILNELKEYGILDHLQSLDNEWKLI